MQYNIKTIHDWPIALRLVVLFLIFLLVVVVGYTWDIRDIKKSLIEVRAQEKDFFIQYQMIVDKEANLKADIAQLPMLSKTLDEWQKSLAPQHELPDLLNEILKLGNTNGLFFALFDPSVPKQSEFFNFLPIDLIVVGNYHQLSGFVSELVNLPWIIVVDELQLTEENKNDVLGAKLAEQANLQGLLTNSLSVKIYFRAGGRVNGK